MIANPDAAATALPPATVADSPLSRSSSDWPVPGMPRSRAYFARIQRLHSLEGTACGVETAVTWVSESGIRCVEASTSHFGDLISTSSVLAILGYRGACWHV